MLPGFSRTLIYVQIHPGYFIARISGQSRNVKRDCQGLIHPRTLAGSFRLISHSVRELFKELKIPFPWFGRPDVLMHLFADPEGGYTDIELRAFREAMVNAGAGDVFLCTDGRLPPFSDSALESALSNAGTKKFAATRYR
jgi:hypothetical protein